MLEENYHNKEQDRRLGEIESSIKIINGEMGDIKVEIAEIKIVVPNSLDVWLK